MERQRSEDSPWADKLAMGLLEMQVTDLDGHVLRCASDGKKDMPCGPWMDAEGKLWPMEASEAG